MRKNQILFQLLLCCLFISVNPKKILAQFRSAAEEEVQKQQELSAYPVAKWDSLRCAWYGECTGRENVAGKGVSTACPLSKRMFGWHAIGTSSASYTWQSLSDLSYFSYQVDYLTGNATNAAQLVNWGNNATVVTAKANGVRVNLAVTFFGTATTFPAFFSNATARNTLITNLVNEVVTADVNGLNIDFEGGGLSTTYAAQFTSFLSALRTQLLAVRPGAEISIDIQGSHVASANYITNLNSVVDLFILMGYDYYWSTQGYPGPIAPTWQFPKAVADVNGHGNVANDLNTMLRYAAKEKVVLAMPYYGRRWRTTNGCVLPADGNANPISTQTYTQFRDNASGYYNTTLRDPYAFTAYHCFNDVNAVPNQQFIDDVYSLQTKYDLIQQRGLAGGAVWRLGYDAGYSDMWDLINKNLSTCAAMPYRDTIYDMGGPLNNYQNNQRYTFTVSPPGAAAISLRFLSFDLENLYDSLWVYDGADSTFPILGSFSNNNIPATLLATSGQLTIRFKSDGGTTKAGFKAIYHCSSEIARSIKSGNWNDAETWENGIVPIATSTAIIMPGHQVAVTTNNDVGFLLVKTGASVLFESSGRLNILH